MWDYFNDFIYRQVTSKKYTSPSKVVRAALRMFEYEESKRTGLIKELKKGENSGFVKDFGREEHLDYLHQKHLTE